MKAKVIITKTIGGGDCWGLEDLIADVGKDDALLIELVHEDIPSFLDGADWSVEWKEEEK